MVIVLVKSTILLFYLLGLGVVNNYSLSNFSIIWESDSRKSNLFYSEGKLLWEVFDFFDYVVNW